MSIQYLNPRNDPYPKYGLNPGVAANGMVFAGGMALDLHTLKRLPGADTIANETRLALKEVEDVIAAAGCTLKDIVKVTCYLADDSYRKEFWEAYTEVFAPGPYPARCTFVVGIAGDCRVELDVVAVQPKKAR